MNQTISTNEAAIEFRIQENRYPWWVKSVDKITTQTDDSRHTKPDFDLPVHMVVFEGEKIKTAAEMSKKVAAKGVKNRVPGKSLRDLALHYSANTYMHYTLGSLGDPSFNIMPGLQKIQNSWKIHPPKELGLDPWQADPQTASDTIEKAGIQLGAAMVGFSAINELWTNKNVKFSDQVEELTQDGMTTIIPKRMKYVISILGVNPPDLTLRNQTELGAAGDRAGYEAAWMATNRMMRFIKGLGYEALEGTVYLPQIPYAITAGLGELGRMNRMINPLFGGNVRIGTIITDLPLALDKPIDFGLQKFCVGCKKCATACPVNALSTADEPYWQPVNQWQAGGKKAYYEDNLTCYDYQMNLDIYCSTCMSVCPWSKQDKTVLHDLAHITAAKLPFLGKWLAYMDDLFGYGLVTDPKQMEEWWDYHNPTRGVDSRQGR